MAAKHTSTQIFLDSDQLEDLDLIFDTIRCTTHSVVVVLTPQVLTRMWCAGEIVTAFKNKILTVPLLCDGYTPPDVELLDHLEEMWTGQQKQILSVHGISLEDVRGAYVWLDAWCESETNSRVFCVELVLAPTPTNTKNSQQKGLKPLLLRGGGMSGGGYFQQP